MTPQSSPCSLAFVRSFHIEFKQQTPVLIFQRQVLPVCWIRCCVAPRCCAKTVSFIIFRKVVDLRIFIHRYMDIFISTWVLAAAGMICAFPLVYVRVKDYTEMDDEAL